MNKTIVSGIKKPWLELKDHQGIAEPLGFYATGVRAHVKYPDKYDVALVCSDCPAAAAGVFTKNSVQAHPVTLSRSHLADGRAQAVVINSGNANACLGEEGERAARMMAEETAQALGLSVQDVVVASTGVIGERFPADKVRQGILRAAEDVVRMRALSGKDAAEPVIAEESTISEESGVSEKSGVSTDQEARRERARGARQAALAIMTTDLVPKEAAYELRLGSGTLRLGIMAKGSGMIHPNMGTLLGFITTDACVDAEKLRKLLCEAADESFNMVTVDGDTSTNDMLVALANGRSGFEPEGEDWEAFRELFLEACRNMARAIAGDGEGASKLLTVRAEGAADKEQARRIARAVCGSNLVKCAIYGRDANWGRIICAVGYADSAVDPGKISVFLNGMQVADRGRAVVFDEGEAAERLGADSVTVLIRLGGGPEEDCAATAWGCDLTHKYIDINADYRS